LVAFLFLKIKMKQQKRLKKILGFKHIKRKKNLSPHLAV
jgi:hypothetical protein